MWPPKPRSRAAQAPTPRRARAGRRRIPLVAAAVALAASLCSGSAFADARTEARIHFRKGMGLIQQKKLVEGIAELERAYEIYPHPNVAFNVATAQAELGHYELAIGAYRTYLDSNPPDRAEVEKAIQDLQGKLALQRAEKVAAPEPSKPPEPKPTEKPPELKPGEKPPEPKPGEPTTTEPKPNEKPPEARPNEIAAPAPKPGEGAAQARGEDVYEQTVVTASRGAQSPLDAPNSTTIITRQDIRLSGHTRIPELLRRVAGMDVIEMTGGEEDVSMRGFNSRQANKLLVLVDGRSVSNDILGSTFWESLTIDVDQIERIEVVRGPGSALYGADAFAGVVNIITIAPGEGKTGFRVGAGDGGQGYASAWAVGHEGDFGFRASMGYTRYPRWTRENSPDRIDLNVGTIIDPNLGAENLRADLRGSYRIDKNNELDFGGGFARVGLDVYGIGPFNDYNISGDNTDVSVDYKGKYVNARAYYDRLAVTAGTDYAYTGHTLNVSHPEQNVVNVEAEYVNDFRFPQALHHDVHIGVGYRLKDITWEYLVQPTPVEHHASAYVQDTIKIADKVNIVASGRADYVPYLKRMVGSPRGSVVFKPTDRQAVRISGSTAFRTPSFLEAYLNLPVQLSLPGVEITSATANSLNPSFVLQPEQVTSAEIGYLNQQSDYFDFEIAAYYNRVSNLIQLAPVSPISLANVAGGLPTYDPRTGAYNAGYGGWNNSTDTYNVFGGEVSAHLYPTEGLDLFANYAINYNVQQVNEPNEQPDQRTSHHKVNAGIQLRTKIGFNGEVTFYYQSSQLWNEQIATLTGIVYEQFPLPAYTLLNARLGWRFYHDRIEISGTVFNALSGTGGCTASCYGLQAPQMHPFGNQIGRRFMGFLSYSM